MTSNRSFVEINGRSVTTDAVSLITYEMQVLILNKRKLAQKRSDWKWTLVRLYITISLYLVTIFVNVILSMQLPGCPMLNYNMNIYFTRSSISHQEPVSVSGLSKQLRVQLFFAHTLTTHGRTNKNV